MSLATGAVLRVLIVEDHSLLIDGLRHLLRRQPRYEVVGAVSSGLDVYKACQDLSPDIVLLDLGLPGMDGIDVIRQLRKRWTQLRIVVVTAAAEEWRGQEAREAGAMAYVLKQSPQQVLLAALQHAALGKPYIDPALRLNSLEPSSSPANNEVPLTLRERQVLKLVAEGHSNRDVAELLSISLKTVETHRLNLMRKLDAHKATELTHWARRLGLI
ncbi:two component system response regulator [Dyella sp. M7H15-1]|uniref:two component system response regulator n=1 Tax=Dyella sp. M7H15-1 TaxID=2501295 RepID=UPI001004DA04|nr:two component system response regulator [Dyella sp. M7H15-1]QAU24837.1 two component system response regulator [Dyella sp. M7H15-1]